MYIGPIELTTYYFSSSRQRQFIMVSPEQEQRGETTRRTDTRDKQNRAAAGTPFYPPYGRASTGPKEEIKETGKERSWYLISM